MSNKKYDITIEQGANLDITTTWYSSYNEQSKTGTVVDITGYSARMKIKKKKEDTNELVELTDGNGGIILGGAAGTIQIVMTAAATTDLDFDKAVYDLELISGSGVVTRFLEGVVTLSKQVTD